MSHRAKWGFCVLSFGALLLMQQPAASLDRPAEQDIGKSVTDIGDALKLAKDNFADIDRKLADLKAKVDALKGDLIRLEDGTAVVKQGTPSTDLVKDDLEKLNAALAEANAKRDEAIGKLDEIFTLLVSIRATKTGDTYPNDLHGFLRSLVDQLTTYLDEAPIAAEELELPAESDKSLRHALVPFYASLKKFNDAVQVPPAGPEIVANITALTSALGAYTPRTFQALPGAPAAASALGGKMAELSQDYTLAAAAKTVDQLIKAANQMTGFIKESPAAAKQVLKQTDAAVTAFNNLSAEIANLKLSDVGLVVRVREAKLGDTYPRYYIANRWCDATAYMRAHCDRQPKCDLGASYQTDVCGYNPAPSAEPRHRGLYVIYECVRNLEANFAGDYDPTPPAGQARLQRPVNDYVVLRGGGSLICAVK